MTEEKYEGWENYETWAVNLWLSNDEGLYRNVCGIVEDAEDEAEAEDGVFFGLVHGFEDEMGYFSLSEMAEVMKEKPYGMAQGGIERDLHWKNKTIGNIKERLEAREGRREA